jgi:uncharacterized membrane protein
MYYRGPVMPSTRHKQIRGTVVRWLQTSARTRLLVAVLIAIGTAALTPGLNPTLRILVAWNAGTWSLVGLAWAILLTASPVQARARAAAEDPGRLFVHVVVLLSAMLSLVAAIALLRERATAHLDHSVSWFVLCLGTVSGAWLLNHTSWSLRYAHLYYGEHEGIGGLVFPGELPPDDMDFAYFAFTVGMCAQCSDVVITSRRIRRAVLLHSLQSFAFNTTVIALMLNVVFGLLST